MLNPRKPKESLIREVEAGIFRLKQRAIKTAASMGFMGLSFCDEFRHDLKPFFFIRSNKLELAWSDYDTVDLEVRIECAKVNIEWQLDYNEASTTQNLVLRTNLFGTKC